MFQNNTRKNRVDPYRHGVLQGNYVEDIFGQDLVKKYYDTKVSETKDWKSETQIRYQWPNLNDPIVKKSDEKLTTNVSHYDLNIDFTKHHALA